MERILPGLCPPKPTEFGRLADEKQKPTFAKASVGEGGKRGIRTLGTVARTTVFETVPFDRSGIFPVESQTNIFFSVYLAQPVLNF